MTDAPATTPAPAPTPGGKGKVEKPEIVLILGLFTCLIYPVIWYMARVKEINTYLGEQKINPMFVFPGCFCPPLLIYVGYLMAKALPDVQKKAGVEAKDEFILHFLLLWLALPVGMFIYQQKLNEAWTK